MEVGNAGVEGLRPPATPQHADVQGGADQAAKPVGTGMFLPLVGRSCNRNKYNRRRNSSNSSLASGQASAARPSPRRNSSSSQLQPPTNQQQLQHASTGSPSWVGQRSSPHVQHQCASGSRGPVLMGPSVYLPAADACAPASTYIVMNSTQGFDSGPFVASSMQNQPLQQQHQPLQQHQPMQQHQPLLQQQPMQQQLQYIQGRPQQLSPFAVASAANTCAVALSTNMTVGYDAGMIPMSLQQAQSVPADASVYSGNVQLYPSTGQQRIGALQQYPSTLQEFRSTSLLELAGPCSTQGLTVAGSAAGNVQEGMFLQAPALHQAGVLNSSAATASGSMFNPVSAGMAGQLGGVASAPLLLPSALSAHDSLIAQANALGLSEQSLQTAVAAALPSSAEAASASPEVLQMCIQQLDVLKGLLSIRQERGQDVLLQLQQHEQQQHVGVSSDGTVAGQLLSNTMQLQQELLQMLQRQQNESGALLSGSQAAAVDMSFDGTVSMLVPHHTSQATMNQLEPATLTWLQAQPQQQQQVQLRPQMMQAQSVIDLTNMMHHSLSLQPQQLQVQQAVMSSPTLMMPQGPQQVIMVNTPQCMGMQH